MLIINYNTFSTNFRQNTELKIAILSCSANSIFALQTLPCQQLLDENDSSNQDFIICDSSHKSLFNRSGFGTCGSSNTSSVLQTAPCTLDFTSGASELCRISFHSPACSHFHFDGFISQTKTASRLRTNAGMNTQHSFLLCSCILQQEHILLSILYSSDR